MPNSRNKGGKNEREVAKLFKTWTSYDFGRVPSSGGLRWKRTTDTTGDIICTDSIHYRRFPLSIEAKFYKEINFEHTILPNSKVRIEDFWNQALDDAERGSKIPILFMRYNGMPKNVHFIGISPKYFRAVINKHIPNTLGQIVFKTPTLKMVVVNSTDFFNSDYLTIYKATRIWLRKQKKYGA